VSYPVERSRHARRLLLVLWLCGLGAATLAWIQSASTGWQSGMLLFCVLAAAWGARAAMFQIPGPAELVFDGQYWSLAGGASLADAAVALDFQALLLIRLTPPHGGVRWLWAERRAMPGRWPDLRRALYARTVIAGNVHAVENPRS
jgi:hypothetical protein